MSGLLAYACGTCGVALAFLLALFGCWYGVVVRVGVIHGVAHIHPLFTVPSSPPPPRVLFNGQAHQRSSLELECQGSLLASVADCDLQRPTGACISVCSERVRARVRMMFLRAGKG